MKSDNTSAIICQLGCLPLVGIIDEEGCAELKFYKN